MLFSKVCRNQLSIQVGDRSKRLDLFFEIETMRQGKWAIIVEMKVQNSISPNQLSSYRKWLDERKEYAQHRKILILLYDDTVQSNHPRIGLNRRKENLDAHYFLQFEEDFTKDFI